MAAVCIIRQTIKLLIYPFVCTTFTALWTLPRFAARFDKWDCAEAAKWFFSMNFYASVVIAMNFVAISIACHPFLKTIFV